jgi:hypothetical protein
MALLNEERRRLLKLPPLTPVDYNCIERAATKLKLIVDTLTVKKRMSGLAIVYKDLTLLRMHREEQLRRQRHFERACRPKLLSVHIYRAWGQYIDIHPNPDFNPESERVIEANEKVDEYYERGLMADGAVNLQMGDYDAN